MSDLDDLLWKMMFMSAVQALALAELVASKDGATGDHDVAAVIFHAERLIDAVPKGVTPYHAARALIYHYMPEYEAREMADYEAPGWLPAHVRDDWNPGDTDAEELIDGVWQKENPRWRNLPGDKSKELNIMAELIERPGQTVAELASAVGASASSVRSTLADMVGLVVSDRSHPKRWSASQALLESSRRPINRSKPMLLWRSTGEDEESQDPILPLPRSIKKPASAAAKSGRASTRPDSSASAKTTKMRPVAASKLAQGGKPALQGRPLARGIESNILAALHQAPGWRYHELAATLSVSEASIRKYLVQLQECGRVEHDGGFPKRWSLTAAEIGERGARAAPVFQATGRRAAELAILEALATRPAQRYLELAAAVSISQTYVRSILHELESVGRVHQDGRRPSRWSLSPSPRA